MQRTAFDGRPGASTPSFRPLLMLMRRTRFSVKALLISVAFLLPLAVLSTYFWQSRRDVIEATRLEQVGAEHLAHVRAVIRAAQLHRQRTLASLAGGGASDGASPVLEPLKALMAHEGRLADQLDSRELATQAAESLQAVPGPADGLFKVFAGHSKALATVLQLQDRIVDGSGLVLDPDLDTYFAMDAALLTLPTLIEQLDKMTHLSATSSALGQGGAVAAQELARLDALIDEAAGKYGEDVRKIRKMRAEVLKQVEVPELRKRMSAFEDLATDQPGAGGAEQAEKVRRAGESLVADLRKQEDELTALLSLWLKEREQQLVHSLWMTLAMVAACVGFAMMMFLAFAQVIREGLSAVHLRVEAIAEGDMRDVSKSGSRDELGAILDDCSDMQGRLSGTISTVKHSAAQVATASQQLSVSTTDLAQRTEQTASQLQRTASSMEEMNAAVAHTASSTQEAAQFAKDNARLAKDGGMIIGDAVSCMQLIQSSASTIGDIIGLIDSIAFQTNILALNAAVEAARAGEQGKGFAVVATEVRNLAKRSAEAAKEIKGLITQSEEQTRKGVDVVLQAGRTMEEVVTAAGRVEELLGQIAVATREQSSGIQQVNGAVTALEQMTQQNAALVEETMAASTAMRNQAELLSKEMDGFKVAGDR